MCHTECVRVFVLRRSFTVVVIEHQHVCVWMSVLYAVLPFV